MELYDYQAEDLQWFLENPKSMILYEPRVGKTVVTTHVVAADPLSQVMLVCAPKNAFMEWKSHLEELYTLLCGRTVEVRFMRGKGTTAAQQRKRLWLQPRTAYLTVYVTTFAGLNVDFEFLQLPSTMKVLSFTTIVGDEVHKHMRNRKTKAVACMKALVNRKSCHRYHPLSGTLANKGGPGDFWPNLNIIAPRIFGSYWGFINTYMEVIDGMWGKEVIGIRNEKAWLQILDKYSRRRFRHIVRPSMPKVQRSKLVVEPDIEQVNMIDRIKEDGFIFNGSSGIIIANTLELVMRYRQIACCPRIFGDAFSVGAAITDLVERLEDEDLTPTPDDRHIVIFSEFRAALAHFERYLRSRGHGDVFQLHGGLEPEELHRRIGEFRRTKGIMLCTSAFAEGFSLAPAQQCFHIGYSWDPNINKQAEDRLVPQVGDYSISSRYYTLHGIDGMVANAMNEKDQMIKVTIGRPSL